jgi:shikimate dehydrogenase
MEKLVGIVGYPVSHSLSPKMHNFAFEKLKINARYVYLPVQADRLEEAILGLRALNFTGANVTVPYKEAVAPLMDSLSSEALQIGAVNTIEIREGSLIGHNTDAPGFINDLASYGIEPKKVLLLGAGGSAKAIIYALLASGCEDITILNRTKEKAEELASKSLSNVKAKALDQASMNSDADLIINTTSVGLEDDEMPWDEFVSFRPGQVVYDLIYNKKTKLLKHAERGGAKAINGLGMLIHQGALAFSIWTGEKPPVDLMKQALLIDLNQKFG